MRPTTMALTVALLAACSSKSAVDTSTGSPSTSASSGGGATGTGGGSLDLPGWKLVWSDEFDGPDGSAVDPAKWVYGGTQDGMYNQELEYYNPGTDNVFVAGGDLHLVAKALPAGGGFTCWYGPCKYTSGKIITKPSGKPSIFEKQYGRFSARMKIPPGQGMWPAFWMLGNDDATHIWPACGEIDVMENVGKTPATVYGTIHGPASGSSTTDKPLGGTSMLPSGALSDDFHVYTVEWKTGEIRFLLDDSLYFTATPSAYPGVWIYDHPFYLLLNLAVGGGWPGSPDASTQFPAELLVDWVRVYDPT